MFSAFCNEERKAIPRGVGKNSQKPTLEQTIRRLGSDRATIS